MKTGTRIGHERRNGGGTLRTAQKQRKTEDYKNGQQVRTVEENGEIWFVAKDVCDILELSNHRMAIQELDDDEKGVSKVYSPGGMNRIFALVMKIWKSRYPIPTLRIL